MIKKTFLFRTLTDFMYIHFEDDDLMVFVVFMDSVKFWIFKNVFISDFDELYMFFLDFAECANVYIL